MPKKGYIPTKEHIEKIKKSKMNTDWSNLSRALKGRNITWGDKIGKALKDRKRPGVGGRKKGCVAWNKGLNKYSNPDKITYGQKKENHWNWKGGISNMNAVERQSSKYKEWRLKIFQRDNYTCQKCGKNGILNAHHKKGFAENETLRYDIRNGITLCEYCHKKIHKMGDFKNEQRS